MKKLLPISACIILTAAATGCNSKTKATPENYIKTLNAYFPDHPDCLLDGSFKFPVETVELPKMKQLDALAAAQVVTADHNPAIHFARYTLTDTGKKAGPHLCYGHREVTSIDSYTSPALSNGFTETQVTYHYKIEDMPMWAKTPQVLEAYPKLAEESTGHATGTATLALTGVGWTVPN